MSDLYKDPDGRINPTSVGETTPTELVDSHDMVHTPEELDYPRVAKRPVVSTSSFELYLDPAGDDDAAGTAGDPIATTQEMWSRLPHIIQHDVNIHFADGTYTADGSSSNSENSPIIYVGQSKQAGLTFEGNTDNPSNVVISTGWFNLQIASNALHHTTWKGIEFQCVVDGYNSGCTFDNCNFRSSTIPDTQTGVGGYHSNLRVVNSDFGGDVEHAYNVKRGTKIYANNNTGSASNSLVRCLEYGDLYLRNEQPSYSNFVVGSGKQNLNVWPNQEIPVAHLSGEDVSSISEAVSLPQEGVQRYRMEITYEDGEAGANNPLKVTFNDMADGEYDYTVRAEDGTFTSRTGENSYTLIEPTASSSADRQYAEFHFSTTYNNRPTVLGVGGSPGVRQEGRYLDNTQAAGGTLADPFSMTFEASAGSADLRYDISVFASNNRRER